MHFIMLFLKCYQLLKDEKTSKKQENQPSNVYRNFPTYSNILIKYTTNINIMISSEIRSDSNLQYDQTLFVSLE